MTCSATWSRSATSGDGRLSDSELLSNLTLLLIAGFETTTNLLGNGLRIMLEDPQVRAAVGDGSVPVAAFVEEVLRYDSPVQIAPSCLGAALARLEAAVAFPRILARRPPADRYRRDRFRLVRQRDEGHDRQDRHRGRDSSWPGPGLRHRRARQVQ